MNIHAELYKSLKETFEKYSEETSFDAFERFVNCALEDLYDELYK